MERSPACAGRASDSDEAVGEREAASPQGVALVAAYSSEDDDHDHDHTPVPPTPPICQSKEAFPRAPAGAGDKRAVPTPTAVEHAANGINTGESSAGAAAAYHDHPRTLEASPSTTSHSADAVGTTAVQEEEGDCCKTTETETIPYAADGGSNNHNDDGGGKSAHFPSLDDLSALVPEEVRLPQPTLCKLTTEEERGLELGRNSSSGARPEAVGGSPIFEVHLRVVPSDFRSASAQHFERGMLAALKRGIDDVVDNGANNLPPSAKGRLSSKAILYLTLLAVVVFAVIPLGSVCVVCGCVFLAWCHSRAAGKTDSSGDAIARSCQLLVAREEENEGGQGDRQGGDEEQGQAGRHETGGGGSGGDSHDGSDVGGSSSSSSSALAGRSWRRNPTSSAATEDASFDFFLNGWGFCCPSRKGCCCCCGNKRAPLASSSPSPSCTDSRRPALVSIKASKELLAVRLVQLLKFADPRANAYLNEPAGQELLAGLQLHPPLPLGQGSPRGLDSPFQQQPPPAVVAIPIAFVA